MQMCRILRVAGQERTNKLSRVRRGSRVQVLGQGRLPPLAHLVELLLILRHLLQNVRQVFEVGLRVRVQGQARVGGPVPWGGGASPPTPLLCEPKTNPTLSVVSLLLSQKVFRSSVTFLQGRLEGKGGLET